MYNDQIRKYGTRCTLENDAGRVSAGKAKPSKGVGKRVVEGLHLAFSEHEQVRD